ncbi:MAG: methylglyoxal synthase [Chloroflexota bacterium]
MTKSHELIGIKKTIALVAHDNKKTDLLEWARFNRGTLSHHHLFGTGTTGSLLEHELGLPITQFKSGPIGGDQQIGAKIAEGEIDFLIFFWDPLEPQPHDPDIKALLRLAVLYNIPTASNRATADFIISSNLMNQEYEKSTPDLDRYLNTRKNIIQEKIG